jgi:hypothetical protein
MQVFSQVVLNVNLRPKNQPAKYLVLLQIQDKLGGMIEVVFGPLIGSTLIAHL